MNIQLAEAEHYFVRQLAQQLGTEIREHLYSDMRDQPIWWSREKTAHMIGDLGVGYVDELIRDGQVNALKSGRNGGGRVLVDPESVKAWKQRLLNERKS